MINMLSAWQWAVMAAVPPLILMLYFLKLRRQPVQVPSTYLWRKTIEDLHVNSIWQRLRQNVLLFLQLLVVLFLILACLRPGYRGAETLGRRSIILIDNSCSMQATDVGQSRLAEARKRAYEMIETLGQGDDLTDSPSNSLSNALGMSGANRKDVAMVIAFNDRADVKQGFTSDKSKLRAAIDSILPTNRTTDLNEALRAASGLANPGRTSEIEDMADVQVAEAMPAKLYILSDGRFAPPQMDLGNLTAEYIPIGSGTASNVAILAFTVERNLEKDGRIEAFARIQNFGEESVQVSVSLSLDGSLIDATDIDIDARSASGVNFEIGDLTEGKLKLELDIDDDMKFDNVAFAGLDPPRQLEMLLVSSGNAALETALRTGQAQALASIRTLGPESLETAEYQQLADSGTIDLILYDRCSPPSMPQANTLFLGDIPPGETWKASEPSGPVFVVDINRAHPMLQYVDMGTVRIVEGQALELPTGGTELLRSDTGILLGIAPRDAYQDAVLGMALMHETDEGVAPNTNWPIKPSFPVFILNSLEYLGGAVANAGSKTIQPGQSAVLNLANRYSKVNVIDPGGTKVKMDRNGQPQLIFTQTDELGFYQAKPTDSDRLLQVFTVNLFSEQESDIVPAADLTIGAQAVQANAPAKDIMRFEIWRWLLAAALVVLTLEWYLYNRRVAV
jgi:hypothetical protein